MNNTAMTKTSEFVKYKNNSSSGSGQGFKHRQIIKIKEIEYEKEKPYECSNNPSSFP